MNVRTKVPLPFPVAELLPKLGYAIKTARIRRRKTAADLAGRLGVSLPTLRKLEAGDSGVSLGTFVSALWILDLTSGLAAALDPSNDKLGMVFDMARLPKRVRHRQEANLDDL